MAATEYSNGQGCSQEIPILVAALGDVGLELSKEKKWIIHRYYTRVGLDHWRFYCTIKDKDGNKKPLYLKNASATRIRRHKKILAKANPFNPQFKEYFQRHKTPSRVQTQAAELETVLKLFDINWQDEQPNQGVCIPEAVAVLEAVRQEVTLC